MERFFSIGSRSLGNIAVILIGEKIATGDMHPFDGSFGGFDEETLKTFQTNEELSALDCENKTPRK